MVNPRIPTGRQARPGQLVRQQALDIPQLAEDHKIIEVTPVWEITPTGEITNEYYIITTDRGTWTFGPHEPVTFPRRPYNQRRDWRSATPPPTPLDLAIGDLLPPRFPLTPDQDPEDSKQLVISVTRNRARPNVVQVTTHSKEDDLLTAEFLPDEPVQYPHRGTKRPSGYNRYQPKLTGFGPYHRGEGEASSLYYLITHPAHRGQWPNYTRQPIPIGANTYLAKPPSKGEPWPKFVGTDTYRRHPRDPQWGTDLPSTPAPPDQLQAAEAAYDAYEARLPGGEATP
jgi:hypothetical protein